MASAESGVSDDGTQPDQPKSPVEIWANYPEFADSAYWHEYLNRLASGRDMHTIFTAAGETGVGKTTAAFAVCLLGDMNGWTAEKATLDPAEYAHLYDKQTLCREHADEGHLKLERFDACDACDYYMQPGSWLLGDEWEQAVDRRRSSSKTNLEASHSVAAKRYRQIFGAYTLPSKNWMDTRFQSDAADFWFQVQETDLGRPKGEAKVYRLNANEHYETDYTKRVETIAWPILDWHSEFKKLQYKKRERMEGEIRRTYIHRDEFEEAKSNFWNKATKKTRYHLVKAMAEWGLAQKDISDILTTAEHVEGLSQQRVSQLVNTESFEEAYEG